MLLNNFKEMLKFITRCRRTDETRGAKQKIISLQFVLEFYYGQNISRGNIFLGQWIIKHWLNIQIEKL